MAARGHAGGLASTSTAAAAVLDAAGFDLILLETVGTGQSEVEVAAAADTTVVLEAPEMGDEVQAIKAGLLEVADIVVVNKGDRPGALADRVAAPGDARRRRAGRASDRPAGRARRRADAAERPRPKEPEVLVTTATTGAGIPELLDVARPASRARPRSERHAGPARARRGPGLGDPRRPAPRGPAHAGPSKGHGPRRSARSPPTSWIPSPRPTSCSRRSEPRRRDRDRARTTGRAHGRARRGPPHDADVPRAFGGRARVLRRPAPSSCRSCRGSRSGPSAATTSRSGSCSAPSRSRRS